MSKGQPDLNEMRQRLTTEADLRAWLLKHLNLKFPKTGICPGHHSPFEYLRQSYFEPSSDLVVWAPRGGGKTRLGAAATLLDLLHKPGVAVRILGGSLEQSLRMWEHLMPDINQFAEDLIQGKPAARSVRLSTAASAGVVTQSQRAVRGLRVQKLRCDEVEMFDPRVWEAAQLVTRTKPAQDDQFPATAGVVEALSTFHRPGALMEKLVEQAQAGRFRLIKWCLFEVLEKCPEARDCATCPLFEDCRGRAKTECDGFVPIDDAIRMKSRVSQETWDAEMLCKKPSRAGCVFGHFDPDLHVTQTLPPAPAGARESDDKQGLYLGIDFGFKNPFACLWVRRDAFGRSFVIDEYVQNYVELPDHIAEIQSRPHGPVRRIGCDPAGTARNEQTGVSSVTRLRQAHFKVACRGSRIQDGLELIRLGLRSGTRDASLFIHPRCQKLIQAMRAYRYGDTRAEVPVKDGPDHLIDALRYYFINRDAGETAVTTY